jgi:hypothetical protein
MGGKVFDNIETATGGPPQVPRISPKLYEKMIAECQPKLERLFERVVVPRDAPCKKDYGDIDFLVEGIRSPSPGPQGLWETTRITLAAVLHVSRGQSQSFGIPHPEVPGAYVQVDVELSPGNGTSDGAELFEWTRFMKGDADLLQIIGIAHRPLGITCNDRGLHVRLKQIEPYDKKKALLFLTRDPDEAMRFYGLNTEKYREGFNSEVELFDWVAAGRFLSRDVFESRIERSDDRSRQLKRPMYRHFVEDYMPHSKQSIGNTWTRQQVVDEAIVAFDRRSEYGAMMDIHRAKEAEEDIWKEVKSVIPAEGKFLASVVRALRRWVIFRDGNPQIGHEPSAPEDYLAWSKFVSENHKSEVLAWVEKHWRDVKGREKTSVIASREAT